MNASLSPAANAAAPVSPLLRLNARLISVLDRIPHAAVALLTRCAIAATFWLSGQTKVDGFALNLVQGEFQFGAPRLGESTVDLFRDEYALPLLSPELAASLAAFAEHLFPMLLLVGLATRYSALALLMMTLVIQVFVYPGAYATHGVWAAALIYLVARGGGPLSLDHLLARRGSAG